MGIRARLLWIALIAALVPALIALARFRDERQANARADVARLAGLAQDSARDLRERIQATAQLHFGLGHARDLETTDREACSAFLSEVRESHPQYTGILTIRPDGRLFCDSLRSGRELDLNDRAYFRQALAATGGVVLEPVFGRLTGRAVMQVAHPVRGAGGELLFVLLASLDLGKLALPAAAGMPGARLLMVDERGLVLVLDPAEGLGFTPGSSIAGSPLGRFASGGPEAAIDTLAMPDGQRHTWARADAQGLAGTGLRVLVGAPERSILAASDRRFQRDAMLYAGLALGLFLLLWALAEGSIRRPLARMTAMARRLGEGDLQARVEAPRPGGELGDLADALNHAAASLQLQRDDIDQLNARLMQSQRLEAIGKLTGGVAHDFNNLLTVVLANADRLVAACATDPASRQAAEGIVDAAQRGAALTRQLLAFARKQPLAPCPVDLNQSVATLQAMLRRTLGEHIEIEVVRGAGLWPAQVDAAQLENALLNLCLNARDAMPDGGKLTLETGNASFDHRFADEHPEVEPGQYTMVAVSDTGVGIAADVLPRVFEPFFTTKALGRGTGLGLAMVYGFVKQSGGHVGIYSEPGLGTTVRVYLPRAHAWPAEVPPTVAAPPLGGTETVLLVEDDDTVRLLATRELEDLGYRVQAAASGAEALSLLAAGCPADLLFTDVVMPGGMSGRELADEVQRLYPALPVLFTSGYTENAIVHHGRLDPGVRLLAKPYRRDDLARAVRAALDGGSA